MNPIHTTYRSTPEIEETERLLREQLIAINQEYRERTKPILDRLVELQNMKRPVIVIPKD